MNTSEIQLSRLAASSSTSTGVGTMTAAALMLLLSVWQHSHQMPDISRTVESVHTADTNLPPRSNDDSAADLARELNRLYSELLGGQREIEPDIRAALYANLADLYT